MKRLKEFFKLFKKTLTRPEMLVLPGQLAFFFILSVVPIITLIGYCISFLNLPISFTADVIEKAFGAEIADLIMPVLSTPSFNIKFIITLIIGFLLSSNGASSIIVTSNTIYKIKDSGFFRRRLKSLIMTIFMVLLIIFILVVPVFGQKIIDLIRYVNLNARITDNIEIVFNVIKGPVSWFVIFLFIKILYTMAPDRKLPSSYVNVGAIFTSISWVICTVIYSYYVNHFARYNYFYGSLANVVVLMLWVYLLAYIYVIGMALNSQDEEIKLEKTSQIEIQKK